MNLEHSNINNSLIEIEKKGLVYAGGLPANGFYYVNDGLIGLYQTSVNGKESLLRIYGPGSYFGYRSLFTNQHYPSTARAMKNSNITKLFINNFKSLYEKNPNLANFLMSEVCEELRLSEKRIIQFNEFSAKKRILDTIYYVFSIQPNYHWTYREIAEYSCTDIATVIRYCKELKTKGILDNNSRRLVPVCLDQLASFTSKN